VSRTSPVHTAMLNCTGDEGGPFGFGDQVVDPKPPRAAVVLKSHSPLSSRMANVAYGSFSTDSAGIVGWLMSALPGKHRCRGRARRIVFGLTPVIQAPKRGSRIMRNELADYEWSVIKPMLPNKPRGVPRVNDRRVLNGIFWVLRSGAPWRDLPEAFGPYTTCYNRFVRWRRAGVWSNMINALAAALRPACVNQALVAR
jgi:transposase